jgi:hypothetical protein
VTPDSRDTWGWLFLDRDVSSSIELVARNEGGEEHKARLFLDSSSIIKLADGHNGISSAGGMGGQPDRRPLVVERSKTDGTVEKISVSAGETGGLTADRILSPWEQAVLISTRTSYSAEMAGWLSKLDSENRLAEVVDAMRILEPRLRRLSLRVLSPGTVIIQADLGGKEHIPLAFAGDGMTRLITHLLAIEEAKDGVALIDEIDNGLHHSVIVGAWTAIAEAARRSDTQVFATTHSRECVAAAHEAFTAAGIYDLRVHRLDLDENGTHRVVTYDEETMEAALDSDWEIRG